MPSGPVHFCICDKACDDLTLSKAMGGAPEVDGLIKQHCSGMPKKR